MRKTTTYPRTGPPTRREGLAGRPPSRFRRGPLILIPIIIIGIISGLSIYKTTTMPKIENFETQEFKTEKSEILIGVISDTHIPTRAKNLPAEIKDIFKNVDLIIHAGDFVNFETKKELEKIAPVIAVEGNMDLKEVREKLPEGIILKIYNFKIGIAHSPTSIWLVSHLDFGEKLAERLAKKENLDILVFGHTHRPHLEEFNFEGRKILLINPGSPTDPLFYQTAVGLLRITKDSFKGQIIYLKK